MGGWERRGEGKYLRGGMVAWKAWYGAKMEVHAGKGEANAAVIARADKVEAHRKVVSTVLFMGRRLVNQQ